MQDLNALIDPSLGITLYSANAINDRGQIVAAYVSGSGVEARTYLLTPVPEPGTWALLSAALLGGGAWVWGRARGKNTSVEP